jgi:hypothetical protein
MSLKLLKPAILSLAITMSMPFSAPVQAHGGLSLADDVCKLTIGPFTMHFTGYQPDSTQEKEFCEDIPAIGRTVVALDYIEEALRPLPTEVRVIRDSGPEDPKDPQALEAATIFHMPAKVYPNGSINFEYNFSQPGKFVGLVTTGEKREHVSRFPFSVGQTKDNTSLIIGGAAAVAIAGVAFLFMRRKTPA